MVGRDTFSMLAPALGSPLKNGYVVLFRCYFHGGYEYNAKYVTSEYILQAAFAVDTIQGVQLESARSNIVRV